MKISVILEALTGRFETDIKRASKESERAFRRMKSEANAAAKVIGASLATAAAGAAYAIKGAIDEMDQISKTAQKIGTTTEALSALQYAAKLSDVSVGQLQAGMTRLVRAQAEAARGTERYVDLFGAIGVAAVNADGTLRNSADVMTDLADVFASLPDGATKTALAVELLGRSGADLIPLLNGGATGLAEMRIEAERLGLVISGEAGRAAEEFNDNITRMGAAVRGAAIEAGAQLLPVLSDLSGQVVSMAKDPAFRDGLADALRGIGEAAIATANGIASLAGTMRFFGESVAAWVSGPAVGDLPRIDDAIAEIERKLKRLDDMRKASGTSGSSDEPALRAELERLRQMRDVTLELAAARKEVAAVAPPGAGAAPRAIGRIFAPSAGAAAQSSGPKKQSTRLRDIYLQQADEGLREVEERYREHARILEGVDRLRLEAMDEHSRSVVQLQDKYGELTAAVQAGAVEQQEAAQIAAGLAQQWSEHVKTETESMSEFAKAAAQNMQTAFADFLFDPFSGSLKSMAAEFAGVLRRMAAEMLAAKIFGSLGKAGEGKTGFMGSLLGFFAGAKDAGGSVPAGTFALVGERRPELVAGPATVVGGAQTASMLRPRERGDTKIRLISITDSQNFNDYLGSDPAEQTLIAFAERNQGFFRQLVAS